MKIKGDLRSFSPFVLLGVELKEDLTVSMHSWTRSPTQKERFYVSFS